jgi:hypothetical protein
MPAFHKLAVRDGTSEGLSTNQLLIIIAVLIVFGLVAKVLVFVFVILPRLRRRREERARMNGFGSNYKQLTVATTTSNLVLQEKLRLMEEDVSPPSSPSSVPEIRITFPDEVDKSGRPRSGGVVVVRMGENSAVGLEPVHDQLPAYSKEGSGFMNMDLEKMGGLKEAPVYH